MKKYMQKTKRLICFGLAATMLCSGLAGCKEKKTGGKVEMNETGLPLTKEVSTLTAFMPLHTNHAGVGITSLNDVASVKALEEKTNVHIEWESPSNANAGDILAQMLASGNYPDILVSGTSNKVVRQSGVVITLNDLIDQYAPNVKKLWEKYPEHEYFSKSAEGKVLSVNSYNPDTRFGGVWTLPMIRQDWLDKLKLSVPATQDEWYNTLKAFKENDMNGNGDPNDEIPMVIHSKWPMNYLGFWPLGITNDFYVEDGTVKFGFLEPEYKEGVTFLKKLYDEKLIDTEFLVQNVQQMEKKIQANLAGACIASAFNYGNEYKRLLADTVPDYNMVVVGNIMSKDGKRYTFAEGTFDRISSMGFYITDKCKTPELAMRWIDYLYSEEGGTLAQFGREGETFDYDANGKPQFRYELLKGSDGLINALNRSKYTLGGDGSYGTGFPHWDEELVKVDGIWKPEDKTAIFGGNDVFNVSYEAALALDTSKMIPSTSMMRYSNDEETEVNQIMTDIEKYVDEITAQFVTGEKDINSEYDTAVNKIKQMGIERVLTIEQEAYGRLDKSMLNR